MTNINVGSPENPVYVPEKALEPETPEGREWWEAVAEGSVILDDAALDALLAKTQDENK